MEVGMFGSMEDAAWHYGMLGYYTTMQSSRERTMEKRSMVDGELVDRVHIRYIACDTYVGESIE